MRALLRLSGLREYLRSSLWVLPTVFVLAALALGTVLAVAQPAAGTRLEPWVFGGTAAGARDLLAALAGAMITVTGLTFSLTVVALQMAAGQYSPRVLRGFLSDRGNQLVLSTLVATFAYCISVLRVIREDDGGGGEVLPQLAVTVGVVLSLIALGMLVYFLHHLTRQLRVETIIRDIANDTLEVVDAMYPDAVTATKAPPLPEPTEHARRILAKRSGYLQAVQHHPLVADAAERDVVVRLRPAVGYHVTATTTLAWVWRRDGEAFAEEELEGLDRLVHDRIQLGIDRTMQQDVVFGLRQLVDVAAKALSTGMNDPTTAVQTLGQLSIVLCRLACRAVGTSVDADADGAVRLVVPRPDFRDYLLLLCDQIRRYGAGEPAVVLALLGVLGDVAEQVSGMAERTAAVEEQVARTLEIAGATLDETDMTRIAGLADVVRTTLSQGRRPEPHVMPD